MSEEAAAAGRLNDEEFAQFLELLRRYSAFELDQWENLSTETPYGPVYIMLTRALPPGWTKEMYRPI
ncbi:hypothetical protein ABT160_42410 [Streptomyces sp. NPDC001941]|uniref:hypothetical protein n=1 Tax=Streptomyces sp. NPDC001941 TaxID=3154659 RepID=UPI00331BFF31